jgi:hypothetical protein
MDTTATAATQPAAPQECSKTSITARRQSAAARQAARDKLSSAQQLARLDKLLGVGKGAVKERLRLHQKIAAAEAEAQARAKADAQLAKKVASRHEERLPVKEARRGRSREA